MPTLPVPSVSASDMACSKAFGASAACGVSGGTALSRHSASIRCRWAGLSTSSSPRSRSSAASPGASGWPRVRCSGPARTGSRRRGWKSCAAARPVLGAQMGLQQRGRIDHAVGRDPGIDSAAAARHRRVEQRLAAADGPARPAARAGAGAVDRANTRAAAAGAARCARAVPALGTAGPVGACDSGRSAWMV